MHGKQFWTRGQVTVAISLFLVDCGMRIPLPVGISRTQGMEIQKQSKTLST